MSRGILEGFHMYGPGCACSETTFLFFRLVKNNQTLRQGTINTNNTKEFVLASYCCYKKLPQIQWPKITQMYSLTFLETRGPKSVSLGQSQGFGWIPFWMIQGRIFPHLSSFQRLLWAFTSLGAFASIFEASSTASCFCHHIASLSKYTCDYSQVPPG